MTDSQKIKRYELENSKTPLTPAERVLLAALNDLREGNDTGRDLAKAQEAVKQAEKALEDEVKGKEGKGTVKPEDVTGAEDVTRVQKNQE